MRINASRINWRARVRGEVMRGVARVVAKIKVAPRDNGALAGGREYFGGAARTNGVLDAVAGHEARRGARPQEGNSPQGSEHTDLLLLPPSANPMHTGPNQAG